MPVPYHEPFFAHTSPSPTTNKWAPYSNARDFTTNMVITLGVLLCGLLLALALNIAVRFLLCRRRRRSPPLTPSAAGDPEKQQAVAVGPTLVFVAKESESAECAICLAEFAEGERVRVLPACNHGFHVSCVDRWLDSQRSCPTCRASCVQPLGKDESNSNGSQVCISL